MPRRADPDPVLPLVVTMDQAVAAGLSPDQVKHRVRSGQWERLARGVYRTSSAPPEPDSWEQVRREHSDRAVAEQLLHPDSYIGLDSAAVVHGLPLWRTPGTDVSLIAGPGGHNGRRPGVTVHRLELHERDVVVDPHPMTTVARTWFDVARAGRLADGLVLGDAALRAGRMTIADVERVIETALARRGVRVAAAAAKRLSGVRETPLESGSWAYFLTHRIPLPRMQVEIRTRNGLFVARVDFLWENKRLVGECDGKLKYESADDLYAEKLREDAVRAEGFRFVRWGAPDLRSSNLVDRLRRLLV